MGYKRLRPRSWPEKQDEEVRQEFMAKLDALRNQPRIEIWYQDECGIQGDSKPRQIWAKKGSRPRPPYTGAHIRENDIGAVSPSDGTFFSLIMPVVNKATFQIYLDHLNDHIGNKWIVMVMDNASWHKAAGLNWGHIVPLYLPAYSPDFNPIERIWLNLKESFFSRFVAKNYNELTERLSDALRYYHSHPEVCMSICHR